MGGAYDVRGIVGECNMFTISRCRLIQIALYTLLTQERLGC